MVKIGHLGLKRGQNEVLGHLALDALDSIQVSMTNFVSLELKSCHFEIFDLSDKILFF